MTELKKDATPFDDGVLYDLVFSNFDYGVDFYLDLARNAGGPVLEVACGTGRVMLPCLDAGVDIDGLDLSPNLLDRLREKAAARGFHPTLHHGDMRGFALPRRYNLIVIPFNAIVHCLTTEDQLAALGCLRAHLAPGGMLAFDTFFPSAAIVTAPNDTRVLEMETPHPETGLPIRVYDTRSFDRVAQIQRSFMEIEELDAAGNIVRTHPSRTEIRWIYKAEMELLLRVAGFDRWSIWGGFDRRPLTDENDAMVVEAV